MWQEWRLSMNNSELLLNKFETALQRIETIIKQDREKQAAEASKLSSVNLNQAALEKIDQALVKLQALEAEISNQASDDKGSIND